MFTGGDDIDPRAHKSVLIQGFERECLGVLNPEQRRPFLALMQEARLFADDELEEICIRTLAVQAAEKGERVKILADIAKHDDTLQRVEAEDRAPQVV